MSAALVESERRSGAVFAAFDAGELPARFTNVDDEWAAVRKRSGLVDARFRGMLRLVGADRVTFLQGMLTNDIAVLEPGHGCYAALLTVQGRIVSDLRVYAGAEELWLDVPITRLAAVREALERFIVADDVEFADTSQCVPLVCVEGPQVQRTLLAIVGESLDQLEPFMHRDKLFDGEPVRVIAATHGGERGFLIAGDAAVAGRLWDRCCAAGAEPVGMEALDVLRVEAGIPWCGRDMDESILISEVGLPAAISFQKGCYLGQEVVERVAARGQVQRRLVGLICDGDALPPAQSKLLHDNKDVGWITSAVRSPMRQSMIAMGYARREAWEPGTAVTISAPDGSTSAARVAELPFYQRQ